MLGIVNGVPVFEENLYNFRDFPFDNLSLKFAEFSRHMPDVAFDTGYALCSSEGVPFLLAKSFSVHYPEGFYNLPVIKAEGFDGSYEISRQLMEKVIKGFSKLENGKEVVVVDFTKTMDMFYSMYWESKKVGSLFGNFYCSSLLELDIPDWPEFRGIAFVDYPDCTNCHALFKDDSEMFITDLNAEQSVKLLNAIEAYDAKKSASINQSSKKTKAASIYEKLCRAEANSIKRNADKGYQLK